MAFIGANPGGGQQEWDDDVNSDSADAPYDKTRQYNAWLDDIHVTGNSGRQTALQERVKKAFEILAGEQYEEVLRNAACFNVVPLRSMNVSKLSRETWMAGVEWCLAVSEHISPDVIICLGNGKDSAWSVFANNVRGDLEKQKVYGTFNLKRGHISYGNLSGAQVIGLPHLSRMGDVEALRRAAVSLGIFLSTSQIARMLIQLVHYCLRKTLPAWSRCIPSGPTMRKSG